MISKAYGFTRSNRSWFGYVKSIAANSGLAELGFRSMRMHMIPTSELKAKISTQSVVCWEISYIRDDLNYSLPISLDLNPDRYWYKYSSRDIQTVGIISKRGPQNPLKALLEVLDKSSIHPGHVPLSEYYYSIIFLEKDSCAAFQLYIHRSGKYCRCKIGDRLIEGNLVGPLHRYLQDFVQKRLL